MISLTAVFILLVVFQLKHFIADYPLQGKYMLGKFKPGWDFLGPLSAHCSVHAAMTFFIALSYIAYVKGLGNHGLMASALAGTCLGAMDFAIHFIMDRVKAGPKYLGRYKALSGPEYMNLMKKFDFASGGVKQAAEELSKLQTVYVGGVNAEHETKVDFWVKNRIFHQHDVDACNKAFKSNVYFWWALGFDQMIHHLTHYGVAYILISLIM